MWLGCEHAAALLDSLAAAESRSLICYDDSDARRSAPTRATWGFNAEVRADLAAPTWQGIVNVADEIDAQSSCSAHVASVLHVSCLRAASRMKSPSTQVALS